MTRQLVKLEIGVDASRNQKDSTGTKVESEVNADKQIVDDQTIHEMLQRAKNEHRKNKQSNFKEDCSLKIATEGATESEAKPKKLKRPSSDSVNEGMLDAEVASSKSGGGGGGPGDAGSKAWTKIDNKAEEYSNGNDATSSQRKKSGSNRRRGKVFFEDEKAKSDTKDDAKVIQATKSAGNPANDEGVHDETVATSTKRNRSSANDKKKASEITEYNDNVIGRRIAFTCLGNLNSAR